MQQRRAPEDVGSPDNKPMIVARIRICRHFVVKTQLLAADEQLLNPLFTVTRKG
jgi:hypothetical protein